MLIREPFDPLKFLERSLCLDDFYSKHITHIVLDGLAALPEEKKRQAWWVVRTYKKLLQVQLDAPKREMRPSIRKLLAQGKVVIKDGKYYLR